jgi:hypothetical protein
MRYHAQAAANMTAAVRPAEDAPPDIASAVPLGRLQLLVIQNLLAQMFQSAR